MKRSFLAVSRLSPWQRRRVREVGERCPSPSPPIVPTLTSWTCRSMALEAGPPDSASSTCGDGRDSHQLHCHHTGPPSIPVPPEYLLSREDDAVLAQHRAEFVHKVLAEAVAAGTGP